MDMKNLLSQIDRIQLNEGTKEVKGGRIHKAEPGGYGRAHDEEDDEDKKKAKKAEPAVKRGRGRPKKGSDAAGNVPKYQNAASLQSFMVGNLPKGGKLPGKASKKHTLKDWIEEINDAVLNEEQNVLPVYSAPGGKTQPSARPTQASIVPGTGQKPEVAKALATIFQQPGGPKIVMPTANAAPTGNTAATTTATGTQAVGEDSDMPPAKIAKPTKPKARSLAQMAEGDVVWGARHSPATFSGRSARTLEEGRDPHTAAYHEGVAHAMEGGAYKCRYDEGSDEHHKYFEGFVHGIHECYGPGGQMDEGMGDIFRGKPDSDLTPIQPFKAPKRVSPAPAVPSKVAYRQMPGQGLPMRGDQYDSPLQRGMDKLRGMFKEDDLDEAGLADFDRELAKLDEMGMDEGYMDEGYMDEDDHSEWIDTQREKAKHAGKGTFHAFGQTFDTATGKSVSKEGWTADLDEGDMLEDDLDEGWMDEGVHPNDMHLDEASGEEVPQDLLNMFAELRSNRIAADKVGTNIQSVVDSIVDARLRSGESMDRAKSSGENMLGRLKQAARNAGVALKLQSSFNDVRAKLRDLTSESMEDPMMEGKFQKLAKKLGGRKGVKDPAALAAYIGRKKYGKKKFQQMAAKGKSRSDESIQAWDQELKRMLSEGMTVTTSTGNQGMPDSVSISANGEDAAQLLKILQNSGITSGGSMPKAGQMSPMTHTRGDSDDGTPNMAAAAVRAMPPGSGMSLQGDYKEEEPIEPYSTETIIGALSDGSEHCDDRGSMSDLQRKLLALEAKDLVHSGGKKLPMPEGNGVSVPVEEKGGTARPPASREKVESALAHDAPRHKRASETKSIYKEDAAPPLGADTKTKVKDPNPDTQNMRMPAGKGFSTDPTEAPNKVPEPTNQDEVNAALAKDAKRDKSDEFQFKQLKAMLDKQLKMVKVPGEKKSVTEGKGDDTGADSGMAQLSMPIGKGMSTKPTEAGRKSPEPVEADQVIDALSAAKPEEAGDQEFASLKKLIAAHIKMPGKENEGASAPNEPQEPKPEPAAAKNDYENNPEKSEKRSEQGVKKMDETETDDQRAFQVAEAKGLKRMCKECGMVMRENHQCDPEMLKEWANTRGNKSAQDETFTAPTSFMTHTLSGGLNKIKRDQTTLPHTEVDVREESDAAMHDWLKLAGLRI